MAENNKDDEVSEGVLEFLDRIMQDETVPRNIGKLSRLRMDLLDFLHEEEAHTYKVSFDPVGKEGDFSCNQSILEVARELEINIMCACGGNGLCGMCKVQITEGEASPLTQKEISEFTHQEIQENYRLACQTYPLSDLKISIPPGSLSVSRRTLLDGLETYIAPNPVVRPYRLRLDPTFIYSSDGYADVLMECIRNCNEIDIEVLRELTDTLSSLDWEFDAIVKDDELISINSPAGRKLGFAVDLGTTEIAGYIMDLESGKTLASKGVTNPQITYGEDVITRIAWASQNKEDARKLRVLVVEALNKLVGKMCSEIDANPHEILDTVVAGNTAMHHLLLGLPVKQLGLSPYAPALKKGVDIKARDIGLKTAPGSYVHLFPNIAGFVGGDHLAMLLTTKLDRYEKPVLALDIGTNTEICLSYQGTLTSVSCASGPAFEGRNIKYGMRACEGSIEKVRILDNKIKYHTVGEKEPIGLCGSGILDAVAQLYLNEIIDKNGKLRENERVIRSENGLEYEITEPPHVVTISQKDIHEIQLAKAAISTGIQILLEQYDLSVNDLEKIVISGGFGTYIDISSAITIGMLPPLPIDAFEQVGNAAGIGAKIALISERKRNEAEDIARKTNYVEIGKVPDFMQIFARSTFLGPWNLKSNMMEVIR